MMLMRFDPFRELEQVTQQVLRRSEFLTSQGMPTFTTRAPRAARRPGGAVSDRESSRCCGAQSS